MTEKALLGELSHYFMQLAPHKTIIYLCFTEGENVAQVVLPLILSIFFWSCSAHASQCMLTLSSTVINPVTWSKTNHFNMLGKVQ